ncbi:hypothetical protein Pmani_007280 [Petrolisthes manimaculis]|uniref:Uncharacterized protein n=1 Tax=Petrolisthes manimaculis TaxID=1843537 RepID=A0AAE1UF10_9EUCA|nr:hypothetical protein Pmani_007280 [Petrolisthes manimaculis]
MEDRDCTENDVLQLCCGLYCRPCVVLGSVVYSSSITRRSMRYTVVLEMVSVVNTASDPVVVGKICRIPS